MHDFPRERNTLGSHAVNTRGEMLVSAFVIAIVASAIAVWSQYNTVYYTDALFANSFGLTYTPPSFYLYFLPFTVGLLLLSAIPLMAYQIRGTEKLRYMTVLGLIMCAGAFALPMYFHLSMAILVLFYVVAGCLIIEAADRIKKDLEAL